MGELRIDAARPRLAPDMDYYIDKSQTEINSKKQVIPPIQDSIKSVTVPVPITKHDRLDSVSSHKKLKIPQANVMTDFASWLWGIIRGENAEKTDETTDSPKDLTNRPKLESPDNYDLSSLDEFASQMSHVMQRVKRTHEEMEKQIQKDPAMRDVIIFQMVLECIKQQRNTLEEGADITKDTVMQLLESNRKLQQKYLTGKQSHQTMKNTSNILGWITAAVSTIAALGTLVAIGVLTSGAGIPAALGVFNAAAAISGGGLGISDSIVRYQKDSKAGDLLTMRETREQTNQKVKDLVDELNRILDAVDRCWSNANQISNNVYGAVRFA